MAQGSSPSPELPCAAVCSESLTQHTAPPSQQHIYGFGKISEEIGSNPPPALWKAFCGAAVPCWESSLSSEAAWHVQLRIAQHKGSAMSAGIYSHIFGQSMMSALLSALRVASPAKQRCDSRAEHLSPTWTCTALTSALRNSSFLTSPWLMPFIHNYCFGVESRVNRAVSAQSRILLIQ